MKKSNLWVGLVFTAVGLGLLLAGKMTQTRLDGLLFSLGGASLGSGIGSLIRYVYWMRPGRRKEYAQRQAQEQIDQNDERCRMIRDRAKAAAYTAGNGMICASMLVFCALDALETSMVWRTVILYLAGLMLAQFLVYDLVFRKLQKKY